jgi:DNA-binding NtrC family response regulator
MNRTVMDESNVLILGDQQRHQIENSLKLMNYTPIVRASVDHCLDLLRNYFYFAVLIDRAFSPADVLEFVLNVRDIDCDVLIIIIGRSEDEPLDPKIQQQGNIAFVNQLVDIESFIQDLSLMLGKDHI